MNPFHGRYFQGYSLVLQLQDQLSCTVGMLAERGVNVDYSTIYRLDQSYAPEMEKRLFDTGGEQSTCELGLFFQ
jgi:IS6 family transposase